MHHSSTCTYTPNFIEMNETFCERTDVHLRPALLGRLCRRVDLEIQHGLQILSRLGPICAVTLNDMTRVRVWELTSPCTVHR